VPGGTVHAIGKGVTLLEVQQNSDTTWRIWDWGRVGPDGEPRETHVEQALAAASYGAPRRPPVKPVWEGQGTRERAPLARSRFFGMNALRVRAETRLGTGGPFQIYAVLEGNGSLRTKEGQRLMLRPGDVWLVPADQGYHWVAPLERELLLVQLLHRA
jgi:mannose-6-phosphate isomerase